MDSKNIIVIGGYGVLGQAVVEQLSLMNHFVSIIDPQGDIDSLDHLAPTPPNLEMFIGARAGNLEPVLEILDLKVDVVIHLGEILEARMVHDPSVFVGNVAESAHVMLTCLKKNIHCLVGLWGSKPAAQNPLLMSLHNKAQLIPFYNVGNGAIRGIQIPWLLDLNQPGTHLLSPFSAVYNYIEIGTTPIIHDSINVDIPIHWTTAKKAATEIAAFAEGPRGRQPKIIEGEIATIRQIVNFTLACMQVDKIQVFRTKLEPLSFEGKDEQIPEGIKVAIGSQIRAARKADTAE